MAIVTTYICDISGKQGVREDFVQVNINSLSFDTNAYRYGCHKKDITKLVHYDVALKLGVIEPKSNDVVPEQTPTFESQLSVLLKDYISDVVYEQVETQMGNRN